MKKNLEVSIILPTLNEEANLKFLIPEIIMHLPNNISNYEIIIVDDNSTDDTVKLVKNLIKGNSIYAQVLWLDADGSMPANVVAELLMKGMEAPNTVFIGSRFVEGGGYKGVEVEDKSIISATKNIYKSEDSLMAVFLSKLFNTFLYKVINSGIKDVTSGFILGKKEYFKDYIFTEASYGDYFVYLVKELKSNNIQMIEVGYICLTRQHGDSKSGTSIRMLLKRAIPYFKAALFDIK